MALELQLMNIVSAVFDDGLEDRMDEVTQAMHVLAHEARTIRHIGAARAAPAVEAALSSREPLARGAFQQRRRSGAPGALTVP